MKQSAEVIAATRAALESQAPISKQSVWLLIKHIDALEQEIKAIKLGLEEVVLPYEIAKALERSWLKILKIQPESYKAQAMTNWKNMFDHLPSDDFLLLSKFYKTSPIHYVSALVYGYAVSMTVDEKLHNGISVIFQSWRRKQFDDQGCAINEFVSDVAAFAKGLYAESTN